MHTGYDITLRYMERVVILTDNYYYRTQLRPIVIVVRKCTFEVACIPYKECRLLQNMPYTLVLKYVIWRVLILANFKVSYLPSFPRFQS